MSLPDYALSSALFDNTTPLDQAARAMQAVGFRQVEIFGQPDHLCHCLDDPEATRRTLEDHGIAVVSVHSPVEGWDNDAWDDEARLASVAAGAQSLRQAALLGASVVVIHPNTRSHPFGQENWRRNWCNTRDSLTRLAEVASEVGVSMALENMPDRGDGERGTRPGVRVDDLLAMIAGLGDQVGILLDVGHCNISDTDPGAEALRSGQKLLELHLQDNEGIPGEDQHLMPGLGTIDWDSLLDTLDGAGYAGLLTFEAGRPEPKDELLQRLGALRSAWNGRTRGEMQ